MDTSEQSKIENVFEGKSSRAPSVAKEGGKIPDTAAADDNNDIDSAVNTLTWPAVYRRSSMISR